MKRGHKSLLFLSFLAVVFLAGGVWASDYYNCSDSQKLFGISGTSDAHAENWSSYEYDFDICFYHYFRDSYVGGAQVHNCLPNSANDVLRISSQTNAHIEAPGKASPDYSDVCYGDLDCFLQVAGSECDAGGGSNQYSRIISFIGDTNTHAFLIPVTGERVLCCKTSQSSPICDYDGTCDSANGEAPINCPDCALKCGDRVVQPWEECDGTNLRGFDCTNFTDDSKYVGGMLSCYTAGHALGCTFNESSCTLSECSDGGDNDGDGARDIWDFGCLENGVYVPGRNNESFYLAQCQDGKDNDGDEMIDSVDGGCLNNQDNSEGLCGDSYLDPGESCDCGATSVGTCNWTAVQDVGQECSDVNEDYRGGTVWCTDSCSYDLDDCEGYPGFCIAEQPFLIEDEEEEGVWLSPSSCKEYNDVYPDDNPQDKANRKELCLNDCVAGASDPVNNGYTGGQLVDWGCGWDPAGDSGGECYFYFNSSASNPDQSCRLDYTITSDCGPDNPFRLVEVTPSPIPPNENWECDAGCGPDKDCQAQILCPRVISLPFIGGFGLALAVIVITLVYVYYRKK